MRLVTFPEISIELSAKDIEVGNNEVNESLKHAVPI
jgi:hypothetical protein